MIDIDIPDFGALHLEHAVFDYNGTLAVTVIDAIRLLLPLPND